MLSESSFNSENIDFYLRELAKAYKKMGGEKHPR